MKLIISIRSWLLRKLSFGRPIVMNVAIDGCINFDGSDRWGLMSDCHVDGSSGVTVLRRLPDNGTPSHD